MFQWYRRHKVNRVKVKPRRDAFPTFLFSFVSVCLSLSFSSAATTTIIGPAGRFMSPVVVANQFPGSRAESGQIERRQSWKRETRPNNASLAGWPLLRHSAARRAAALVPTKLATSQSAAPRDLHDQPAEAEMGTFLDVTRYAKKSRKEKKRRKPRRTSKIVPVFRVASASMLDNSDALTPWCDLIPRRLAQHPIDSQRSSPALPGNTKG